MPLKAKFQQTKECEECSDTFPRKRGRMTDEKWEETRFCSRRCYYAWQRKQGPRGSEGRIEECAAHDCSRTFWAVGRQKHCRDPECKRIRTRELERLHVEQHGTPHDLWAFDQDTRDSELRRLIAEQEFEAKHGDVFFAGSKNGLGISRLSEVSRADETSEGDEGHLLVVADPSGIPRAVGRPRRRSHVPARKPRLQQETLAA